MSATAAAFMGFALAIPFSLGYALGYRRAKAEAVREIDRLIAKVDASRKR